MSNYVIRQLIKIKTIMTNDRTTEITNYIDAYVGYRVKMRRLTVGLKLKELGEAIGINAEQLKKHEKGSSKIYSGTLHRISQVLKVPISYFFDEVEDNMQFVFSIKDSAGILGIVVDEKEIFPLVKIYSDLKVTQHFL